MLKWSPKPDITTFELAQCMTVLIASMQKYSTPDRVQRTFDKQPDEVKRHWDVVTEDA